MPLQGDHVTHSTLDRALPYPNILGPFRAKKRHKPNTIIHNLYMVIICPYFFKKTKHIINITNYYIAI